MNGAIKEKNDAREDDFPSFILHADIMERKEGWKYLGLSQGLRERKREM